MTVNKMNDTGNNIISNYTLDNLLQRFGLSTLASATSAVICNPI